MGAAKVPLFAMYKYDPSILNDIILPEGIDKQLFINELLLSCGEFGVIYTDPGFLKFAVAHWANKWNHTFSEWLKGISAEYNPIYNYDRYEESTDTDSKSSTYKTDAEYDQNRTGSENASESIENSNSKYSSGSDNRTIDMGDLVTKDLTDTETKNLSDSVTSGSDITVNTSGTDTSAQLTDGEVEHTVSAFDSSVYQPASKDVTNIGSSQITKSGQTITDQDDFSTTYYSGTDEFTHTGTESTTHAGTDNRTLSESGTDTFTGSNSKQSSLSDRLHVEGTLSDVTGSETNEHTHELHNYGNIGVTTAPAMLKEFYNISSWNLIDHMVELFKVEFLILTY